jgi:hypothetical protein
MTSRVAVPLAAAATAALFITAAVPLLPASAACAASESLSCQTINGRTVCVHGSGANASSSLSCRTINGNTVCNGSGGLHCATIGGRFTCNGGGDGSKPQIVAPSARTGAWPSSLMPDLDDGDGEGGL